MARDRRPDVGFISGLVSLFWVYQKKVREGEAASGIDVDDLTETESLIEELCNKEDNFVDVGSARKLSEKTNAEDVRIKALERIGETNKRKSCDLEGLSKPKKTRRSSSKLIEYLKGKSSTDIELRREELEVKKNEQEIQKQASIQTGAQQLKIMHMMQEQNKKMMESQSMLLQQQQQMSMALLGVMQSLQTSKYSANLLRNSFLDIHINA